MRIKYNSIEERLKIINDNSTLFLIGEEQLLEGNYLIFSDIKPQIPNYESFQTIIENKISTLEAENETLKASMQATQQAVDFIVMNGGI